LVGDRSPLSNLLTIDVSTSIAAAICLNNSPRYSLNPFSREAKVIIMAILNLTDYVKNRNILRYKKTNVSISRYLNYLKRVETYVNLGAQKSYGNHSLPKRA
jgi:hypothetical protein